MLNNVIRVSNLEAFASLVPPMREVTIIDGNEAKETTQPTTVFFQLIRSKVRGNPVFDQQQYDLTLSGYAAEAAGVPAGAVVTLTEQLRAEIDSTTGKGYTPRDESIRKLALEMADRVVARLTGIGYRVVNGSITTLESLEQRLGSFGFEVVNKGGKGHEAIFELAPDESTLHAEVESLQDLLSLVEEPAGLEYLWSLTEAQREELFVWAMNVHLRASDNNDIVVPMRPKFLPSQRDYGFVQQHLLDDGIEVEQEWLFRLTDQEFQELRDWVLDPVIGDVSYPDKPRRPRPEWLTGKLAVG